MKTKPAAFSVLAALTFAGSAWLARAADAPEAVIARALQIPGADLSALQSVDDPSSLPRSGTWWSLQHDHWPPAPCNSLFGLADVPIWRLSGSNAIFLVDDSEIDYAALGSLQAAAGLVGRYDMDSGSGDGGGWCHSTNDLWIELVSAAITNPTNVCASLVVHAPQAEAGGFFDLFFRTDLVTGNHWWWIARGLPGQTNFTVANLSPGTGFFILGTTNGMDTNGLTAAYRGLVGGTDTLTNDFDGDGMGDAWEILHFGDLSQTADGDFDGDGQSNLFAYQHGAEPNVIAFAMEFPHTYVSANSATGALYVLKGVPASVAVLVNPTNFDSAGWQPYNSNVVVSLGTNDGDYEVWIGLRGRTEDSQQTWLGTTITRDTVPPVIAVTSPAATTLSQLVIQLQGYVSESLSRLTYDLSNAAGLLTNQSGFITGALPDTNTWKFTTNYFQCYDIALTNGDNRITLRATDLAGNTATTNLTFTLDYSSDTNPPTLAVNWPANNALVSGSNFVLTGSVDEDTVSVVVSDGVNTIPGLLERGGRFSVPGLSLAGSTNAFTIIMTDAAGNSSTQSLTIRQSAISLTINPVSADQLSGTFIALSGSISDTNQQVWLNGHPATVSNTTWMASIPAPRGSSTQVVVQAGSDLSTLIAEQSLTIYMPSRIQAVTWLRNYSKIEPDLDDGQFDDYLTTAQQAWQADVGGQSRNGYKDTRSFPPDPPSYINADNTLVNWPADWPDGQTFIGTEIHNSSSEEYDETASLPWQFGQHSEFAVLAAADGDGSITARFGEQTKLVLVATGAARPGQQSLVRLLISAAGYSGSLAGSSAAFDGPGDLPDPVATILAWGQPLTATATNALVGEVIVSQAADSKQEVPLTVTGAHGQVHSITANAEDVTLKILDSVNGSDLTGRTNTAFVGQQINLQCALSLTNVPMTNFQWTVPGYAISNYVANVNSGTVYSNFPTANSNVVFYWVDGASNRQVQCSTMIGGRNLSAKTVFDIQRPSVQLTASAPGGIGADTNFVVPGTWLHFGGSVVGADIVPGVKFTVQGANTNDYFFLQTGSAHEEDAGNDGTNYVATSSGIDNGNDTNDYVYPFDPNFGNVATVDFPASSLSGTVTNVSRTDSYAMYLMFKPSVSGQKIMVPLKKADWAWSANCALTNAPLNLWKLTSSTSPNPSATDTTSYPTWTNHIQPIQWSPRPPP